CHSMNRPKSSSTANEARFVVSRLSTPASVVLHAGSALVFSSGRNRVPRRDGGLVGERLMVVPRMELRHEVPMEGQEFQAGTRCRLCRPGGHGLIARPPAAGFPGFMCQFMCSSVRFWGKVGMVGIAMLLS